MTPKRIDYPVQTEERGRSCLPVDDTLLPWHSLSVTHHNGRNGCNCTELYTVVQSISLTPPSLQRGMSLDDMSGVCQHPTWGVGREHSLSLSLLIPDRKGMTLSLWIFTVSSSVADPDPGSEIRDPVPFWPRDPGWVKSQDPGPGSGIMFPKA